MLVFLFFFLVFFFSPFFFLILLNACGVVAFQKKYFFWGKSTNAWRNYICICGFWWHKKFLKLNFLWKNQELSFKSISKHDTSLLSLVFTQKLDIDLDYVSWLIFSSFFFFLSYAVIQTFWCMQLIQFFNMNSGLLLTWKFWSSGWHLSSLHWLYNTIWVINPQFLLTHVDSICPLILTCSFSWYVIHQVFLLCSAGFSISISKKLWSKFCSCFADSWASQLWLGLKYILCWSAFN